MPATKREVSDYLASKRANHSTHTTAQYWQSILASASVSSERLTGSPEWDTYLMKLQHLLEDAQSSCATWLERCGGAMKDEDVRLSQFNYQACHARVETLKEVMALPKEIIQLQREVSLSEDRPVRPVAVSE